MPSTESQPLKRTVSFGSPNRWSWSEGGELDLVWPFDETMDDGDDHDNCQVFTVFPDTVVDLVLPEFLR